MRVLIVDDDVLIRKWLTMLLEQVTACEISVHMAENGVQALEDIAAHGAPDLVITDIKMPQMDGLELCRRLKDDLPELPVAILSSYDEFPLVKKALQYGAIDYILKADMNLDDIAGIIEKARKIAAHKGGAAADTSADYAEEKRRLLAEYLESGSGDDHTFLLRLGLERPLSELALMAFRLDRSIDAALQTLDEQCTEGLALIPWHTGSYLAFAYKKDGGAAYSQQKRSAAQACLHYMQAQASFSVAAWSTVLNCQEMGIYTAIQVCQDVLDFKYYYSLENFEQTPYHERGESAQIAQLPLYKRFFESAGRYQIKEAEQLLRRCLDMLHESCTHPADIRHHILVMCHKLLSDISMLNIGDGWFDSTLMLLHEVEEAPRREIRERALTNFLEQYDMAVSAAAPRRSDAVTQAIAYIDQHYTEKITLEQVAAQSHVNNTYMSELFKKEIGITLNDYINNRRVIHACERLRFSNCSMGEIAEQCGFSDQNYFTKVFKKFLNTTPSSYRANAKKP